MKNLKSIIALLVLTVFSVNVWGVEAVGTFTKVTDASTLAANDEIIIVADAANYALSTTQNSNNRGQAAVAKSDNEIALSSGSNVQLLTLSVKNSHFEFNTGSGYLYAASSSSNHLKTQDSNNANGEWTISINDKGVATITAQGSNSRNVMQYNSGSSIFSCYGSATQGALTIYKKAPSTFSVTYNANGATSGTVPTDATAYTSGATVTVKGNTGNLVKMNKKFGGWNTNQSGTGTNYAENATFSITANTTLYAKWNDITYTDYITECSGDPEIGVSPDAVDGLGYVYGSAASESIVKDFTVVGGNLSQKVTVTAPIGFEVKSEGAFADKVELTPSAEGLINQKISVRLSSGKTVNADGYTGNVTIHSAEIAEDKTVVLSATVTPAQLTTPEVTATPGVHQITLSWEAVSNADSYQLSWDGGTPETVTSPVTKTDLTGGQSYSYSLVAIGTGNYSNSEAAASSAIAGKETYTVKFFNSGSELTELEKHIEEGATFGTLPTLTESCDPKSTTFVGWTREEAWGGKVASFDNFVTSSTSVNAAMILNAVWAEETVVPSTTYSKITSESNLTEGNYVIAYKYDNNSQFVLKNEANGSYTTQLAGYVWAPTSDQYSNPNAAYIWKITPQNDGSCTIYNAAVEKYVNATSAVSGDGTVVLSETPSYFDMTYDNSGSRWVVALKDGGDYCLHGYTSGSANYFKVSTSPKTSGTTYKYRTHLYKQGTTIGRRNFITTCSTAPLIEVSKESLNGFSTIATTGNPSAAQSFTVEGYNLTENITVSATTGYEVSTTEAGSYASSLTLTATNGIVNKTTVYVRLAAADAAVASVEGNISLTSSGVNKSITLSGTVLAKTLQSISVKTAPTKTTYTIGEKFNPAGLVITATYNSGDEEVAYAGNESEFTFNPILETALTASDNKVTITWGGQSKDQSITMQCTVAWQVNGQPWTEGTPTTLVNVGGKISAMPTDPTSEACNGKTFVGWSATTINKTDDEPALLTKVADFTTLNAHTTYHAVFAKGEVSGEANYSLVESALTDWSGDYLIVYNTYAMNTHSGNQNANTFATYTDISEYYENKIIASNTTTDAFVYRAAKTTNGYSLYCVSDNSYLGITSNTTSTGSKLRWNTSYTASADDWTLGVGSIGNVGSNTLYIRWNNNSGSYRFAAYASNGQQAIQLFKKSIAISYSEYSTTCFEPVEVPVFDLAEGIYKTTQEVGLTCATEDSKIYYSINDGEVTEYTTKIQLNARGTYSITAYAKVGEERISDPVTKVYTLNLPFDNIQAMYAANLADNTEEVGLTLTGAYINKVYSVADNKQIFVQQGNVGAILAMSGDVPEGLADGKALTATVWGTYKINNDRPQLSNFTLVEGYQVAEGTRPTPAVITSLDAEKVSTNLLGLVTMTGIYSISKESNNITMNSQADGLGTNYALYNIFSAVKALPEQSLACDVIGLFNVKDGVYSIIPIVAATDFKLQTPKDATLPNIDIVGGATSENPVLVPANQVVTLTAVDGFDAYYKVNGGTEAKFTGAKTVTITEPTSITMRGARDYYTDVTITYYYDIDAAHIVHAVNKPDVGPYTYSANKASAEAGELVTMTITPNEHWNILSVKAEYNDGEADQSITATSIGDNQYTFEMPDYDVKIKVDKKQDPTYKVTYLKGGKTTEGEDPQNSTQFEGDIVTVATNSWTATGYTFEGWKITYTNNESQEIEITPIEGKFEMPAFNVKITATWKKIASYGWKLVESTDDLAAGDKVVIACNTQGAAAGAISSSIMSKVEATFSEDSKYLISDLKDVEILTVGGEAGAWTFANDQSNLLGATAAKKVAWGSGTTTWSISIDNYYNATIQSGTDSYGRFLYNVGSPRFAPYTSNVSASMFLPQLYKRVELAYIVTYVANGGSNPPADSYADTEGNVTITSSQPTWNNTHLFIGWNTDKDGNGEEYLAGETYMIEDNLKLYAQWKTVEEHSITFVAGEGVTGAVPTISKKYEGMTFEMPDKGTLEKTGFLFRGWNDGNAIYKAGETYTMPGNDVTFNAVWESKADSKWHLVTNEAMLTDGSKIIIAAAGYNKALSEIQDKKDFCDAIDIEKQVDIDHHNDNKLIYETEPIIFTLVKNADGSFALKNGENYLSVKETSSNMTYSASINNLSSWTITITADKTTIQSKKENSTIYMQYNSDAPRFNGYTGTQKAIAIYKYIDGNKAVREVTAGTYTTFCIPQGVEVGNFYGATFWNIADKAYMEDGVRLYSITIEQEEGNLGAGVPYIMLPDAETTEFVYYATGDEEVAGTNNGLYGTFVDYAFDLYETTARDAQQLYVISDGTLYLCGTGCGVYANRAYIKSNMINYVAPSGAPRRTIGRPNDTPTTLNGLFGNQAGKAQKALIDGHIYILRDNKMYNAQGLFVK